MKAGAQVPKFLAENVDGKTVTLFCFSVPNIIRYLSLTSQKTESYLLTSTGPCKSIC